MFIPLCLSETWWEGTKDMKQQAMTQAHMKSISKIYGDSLQLEGNEQN